MHFSYELSNLSERFVNSYYLITSIQMFQNPMFKRSFVRNFDVYDLDLDGKIPYEEFAQAIYGSTADIGTRKAFKLADINGKSD